MTCESALGLAPGQESEPALEKMSGQAVEVCIKQLELLAELGERAPASGNELAVTGRLLPADEVGRTHLRMELQTEGALAVSKRLVRTGDRAGERNGSNRQSEAFSVEAEDWEAARQAGEDGVALARAGEIHVVHPDFGARPLDRGSECASQQLAAEADAQIRRSLSTASRIQARAGASAESLADMLPPRTRAPSNHRGSGNRPLVVQTTS
jgi:hypothetical protein